MHHGYRAIALPMMAVTGTASDGPGHEEAFARRVRAYGRPGDVLLAVSTPGRPASGA